MGRLVLKKKIQVSNPELWSCVCDCGRKTTVHGSQLRRKPGGKSNTRSCGCLRRDLLHEKNQKTARRLDGKRFGMLTVLGRAANSNHGKSMWNVRCDCGSNRVVLEASLVMGRSKSCGHANNGGRTRKLRTHALCGKHISTRQLAVIVGCSTNSILQRIKRGGNVFLPKRKNETNQL